ncbi:hypothetical protein OY671_009977, partial [Metschnikowia pulcherrima]
TAVTYTYLINGHGPQENWTGSFRPGERVRSRFINAATMTIFNIRIPGSPMTVVSADGQNVRPVTVDEFQIGNAETYDAIIEPAEDKAFTSVAESIDRSGMASATLASRMGMTAPIPPSRPRPTLTMKDMGMGGMDHGSMAGMDHSAMGHGAMAAGADAVTADHGGMDHSGMDHGGSHSMGGMNMRD